MNELTALEFDDFFRSLWGHGPFPWQERLARRVLQDGGWPEGLALPTGAGKTACIDIAVFAVACQAERPPAERSSPLRIFFVVDRRIIVDEAYERALTLARKLREANSGILKLVADRLRNISGGAEPLACFQLRGGMYRDDAWAKSPIQPTIVASTVDQIGSRLLFRGYGLRSGFMWPIHAGLVANDSLLILDEAHCAKPFLQTARAISRYRRWRKIDDESFQGRPFHLVVMSATPPPGVEDVLFADREDHEHPVLGRRIGARKPADLIEARNARGTHALERLAEALIAQAKALVNEERRAIGIIVNRVETARQIYQRLRGSQEHDVLLLTGRMRPIDRDAVTQALLGQLRTDGERAFDKPLFVVATQTLEVGANLDFDGLVSECASLDALRQRLGRLNRAGRSIEARACIVIRGDQTKEEKEEAKTDPVYGNALPRTWRWLGDRAEAGVIDLGVAAVESLLAGDARETIAELSAPALDAPVMLPAHLDAWCQTSPTPVPDPDVSVFLHGPQQGAPEVQVCWRADVSYDAEIEVIEQQSAWIDAVSQCPPSSIECMAVPLGVFRRWMSGEARPEDVSDVEGGRIDQDVDESPAVRAALCWRGPEHSELVMDPREVRPGETVVLGVTQGGWKVFGHVPEDAPKDRGDEAHLRARALPVIRIHREVIRDWPDSPAKAALLKLGPGEQETPETTDILELLEEISHADEAPPWLAKAVTGLRMQKKQQRELVERPSHTWFALRGKKRVPGLAARDEVVEFNDLFTDEDESSSATVEIGLTEHLEGVCEFAERFAGAAGLSPSLVEDLALAGALHDLGKADPRFQALLHGGNPWMALASGRLLAKSAALPTGAAERTRAHVQSGYPKGGRHELLSVKLAEGSATLSKAHDPDLVLHLVAAHHGRCRPFAPVIEDGDPVEIEMDFRGERLGAGSATTLERMDSGVAERFWRLIRRYGWWGLAWLEAILRLADHRRSEAEREHRRTTEQARVSEEVL